MKEIPVPQTSPPKPPSVGFAAYLVAALSVLGCQTVTVDLGSNQRDAGGGGSVSAAPSLAGLEPSTSADCPAVTEAEVNQIYGYPCATTCADAPGTPRAVSSSAELEALVSGQWLTCAGAPPWAADVVGIEFQAGCTVFLLHDVQDGGPDAGVVRGIAPDDQGTYNVLETTFGTHVTHALELNFPEGSWRATVTTSDCPHWMRLAPAGGPVIDLSGITSAHGPID